MRLETNRHFGNKKKEDLKSKINDLAKHSENKKCIEE
jgi:hypothetical protein